MMAPELDTSPGHVLCPACSGYGVWHLGSSNNGGSVPCGLCETRAQVPEEQAEAFWDAVAELQHEGRQTRDRAVWRVKSTWR